MGIEDQSIQAYQTIGQPPSAPQLSSAQQDYQKQYSAQIGAPMPMARPMDMMARPAMPQPMEMIRPAMPQPMPPPMGGLSGMADKMIDMRARPDFGFDSPKPHQDMYKPQFGIMASQLGSIADQLKRAGGMNGGSQIGKFSGGFGQPGAGLTGIGQIGNMKQPMPAERQDPYKMYQADALKQPMQQASQLQSLYSPLQQQMMAPIKAMRGGGNTGEEEQEVEHKGPEDLSGIARHLASKGRGGDSVLIHINPQELKGIKAALKEKGYDISYNPHTGLPEALFGGLKKAFKKVASGVKSVVSKVKEKVGPVFTKLRDIAQSTAAVVGNYLVPGSGFITSGLVSKGAQKHLNSGLGKLAMTVSGGGFNPATLLKSGFSSIAKGGLSGALKNFGSNLMGGIKGLGGKLMGGLKNFGGGIKNLFSNPLGTLKDWGGKAIGWAKDKFGDLKEAAGNAIDNFLGGGEGAEGAEGGEGGYGAEGGGYSAAGGAGGAAGGGNLGDMATALMGLYSAAHPFKDPREEAGITNLPKVEIPKYEVKQVPNPNYGKPGEPFYLSQDVTPAAPAAPPAPVQAAGGGLMGVSSQMVAQRNPGYAQGGNVYEYAAGGKLLEGPGDGMSDSIPAEIRGKKVQKALLADGEFVIPADVVSGLGNGSTKAGSKVLYAMMDRVREARTGTKEQGKQIDPNDFVPA